MVSAVKVCSSAQRRLRRYFEIRPAPGRYVTKVLAFPECARPRAQQRASIVRFRKRKAYQYSDVAAAGTAALRILRSSLGREIFLHPATPHEARCRKVRF